ncbi:hypothetical protein COCOBI_12-3450 [Coccomyxa sp. Obi]|nr:hypothetical protein COCOBI_12-3450 [Coccomyxa sp. Obi]
MSECTLDQYCLCSTSGRDTNSTDHVLADSNLVWQVTKALQAHTSVWDFHEWYSLSTVNKAFRSALDGQPIALKLGRQVREQEREVMEHSKLHIVHLELHPQDERVSSILLSPAFRSFEQFMTYGHQFKSLRTLELTTGDYGRAAQPLLIPFQSKWVQALESLHELTLRGYLLLELLHLPKTLRFLDLSACKVSYEAAVCLPALLRLTSLAIPSSGGRFCFENHD